MKYSPLIRKWIKEYPNKLTFRPLSLAPETVRARMSDAVRGYLTFNWQPNDVDHEELKNIWTDTRIRATEDLVEVYANSNKEPEIEMVADTDSLFTLTNPSRIELIAALTLANNDHFDNKRVAVQELTQDLIPFINSDELTKSFPNVIIESIDRNTYRIL